MESVVRRRERSARLSELAKSLGRDRFVETLQEEAVPEESIEENATELLEPSVSQTDLLEETVEDEVSEELLGELGPGNSDYGMLDELIPQFDFGAIPLTQPKRVLAKNEAGEPGESGDSPSKSSNAKSGEASPRRKTNPASLLDSYFKGL